MTLSVGFNLCTMYTKAVAQPLLNVQAVRHLFDCVKSGSASSNTPLKSLRVESGQPALSTRRYQLLIRQTPAYSFRARAPLPNLDQRWLQSQSELFYVKLNTTAGTSSSADVKVFCPLLRRMERKRRREGVPKKQWDRSEEYRRRKRRAETGPISFEDWKIETGAVEEQ